MMKYYNLILFCCYLSLSTAQDTLEIALYEMPDVIFKKIDTPKNYAAAYELKVKQPLDHKDESKGQFLMVNDRSWAHLPIYELILFRL